jgi:alpha-galactosidase
MMLQTGCYITESSEHLAEYLPHFIRATHPELIEEYDIPLDEYPRRCLAQIEEWKKMSAELVGNADLTHSLTHEYGSVDRPDSPALRRPDRSARRLAAEIPLNRDYI